MKKNSVITGIVFIAVAIILGAFGAHLLDKYLAVDKLASFETGVRYQIYHGLALLVLGLNAEKLPNLRLTTRLLTIGTLLFSGSIYLLIVSPVFDLNLKFLGPVTPIGGAVLITAWILLLFAILKQKK